MKTTYLFFAATLIISSCTRSSNTAIGGIYVREIKQEFAIGWDTIVVKPATGVNDEKFTVQRISSYKQVVEGKELPLKTETHRWMASFDNKNNELRLENKEIVYHYIPQEQAFATAATKYLKIKNR